MSLITLKSKDNISYEINISLIKYLRTVKCLIDDMNDQISTQPINLPLSSTQLQKVIAFLHRHRNQMDKLDTSINDNNPNVNAKDSSTGNDTANLQLEERLKVDPYDKQLFGDFKETAEAADYLDFPQLLVAAERWAAVIINNTDTDQIYDLFGVRHLSNEEEESIANFAQDLLSRRGLTPSTMQPTDDISEELFAYIQENHLKFRTLMY